MELKSQLDAMRELSHVYYKAQKANKTSVRLAAFDLHGKVKLVDKLLFRNVKTKTNDQDAAKKAKNPGRAM